MGLRNERALRALRTLDEGNIAEAYLQGDIDLEGRHAEAFRAPRPSRRPPPAGRGLALPRAAAVRAGLHQQAGDLLALQRRPEAVPELPRSGLPGLQPGRLCQ